MKTAIGIACLVAVGGAVLYGAILVGKWLLDFWRELGQALDDDPARDCGRDSHEEDRPCQKR